MRRSRIVQTLNVPQRVRLRPSFAAALLDEIFEPPAEQYCCCCGTRANHRSSRVQNIVFPQPYKAEREQPSRRKTLQVALSRLVDARTHVKIDHLQSLC